MLAVFAYGGWLAVVAFVVKKKRNWKIVPVQFLLVTLVLVMTHVMANQVSSREISRITSLTSHTASLFADEISRVGSSLEALQSREGIKQSNLVSSSWVNQTSHVEAALLIKRRTDGKFEGISGLIKADSVPQRVSNGSVLNIENKKFSDVWMGRKSIFQSKKIIPNSNSVVISSPIVDGSGKVILAACIVMSDQIWRQAMSNVQISMSLMGLFLCFLVLLGGVTILETNHSLQEIRVSKAELSNQKDQIQQQMAAISLANQQMADSRNKLEMANQKLHALATLDGLTGVMNHRTLMEYLSDHMKRNSVIGSPCSVILLDIDNFKQLNDQYGHKAGDDALRVIAHVLRVCAPNGCGVGRYGGEEFMVVLPGYSESAAMGIGEEIRRQIQIAPMTSRPCTASVGISTVYSMNKSEQSLIDEADKAMYYAKRNGKNRVIAYGHGLIDHSA